MVDTAIYAIVALLLVMFLFDDTIVKIITARKKVQLQIEKERTEQTRLEHETAKIKAGVTDTTTA